LACHHALSFEKLVIKDIFGLIPFEEFYKLNIDMSGPLWWGSEWNFGKGGFVDCTVYGLSIVATI
jgi:hypothetical protein